MSNSKEPVPAGPVERSNEGSSVLRRFVVVVGNPKPNSRTLAVAEKIGGQLARSWRSDATQSRTIDLSELGSQLLDWQSTAVEAAVCAVKEADIAVIASPTYKASYSGLLKVFLDRFDAGSLSGVVVVPTMVAASPQHAMAVDVHLRPVLIELGATCVTPAAFVLESQLLDIDGTVAAWLQRARPSLSLVLGSS